jgi:hypothetical protein
MGRREDRENNVLHGPWLSFMIADHGCATGGPAVAAGGDPTQLLCFADPVSPLLQKEQL